jgi:pimeloyl-ACP methyl ester carboxylesterase
MATLHTEKIGNTGHPIVILHGWGHSLESLRPMAQHLAHLATVYLVDLPGFGKSPMPEEVWDTFQYAERIIAFLDSQGIEKADILGHSFGGKIALCLAIRHPERIRKLIVMNASGLQRKRSRREQCRFHTIRLLGKCIKFIDKMTGTKNFQRHFIPRFGSTDYKQAGVMRPILVKTVNDDLSKQIGQIRAPTLILWGDQDRETPMEIAERIHSQIPHSQLYIFPGKGHRPYEECGSHLCATYIKSFLNRGDE